MSCHAPAAVTITDCTDTMALLGSRLDAKDAVRATICMWCYQRKLTWKEEGALTSVLKMFCYSEMPSQQRCIVLDSPSCHILVR